MDDNDNMQLNTSIDPFECFDYRLYLYCVAIKIIHSTINCKVNEDSKANIIINKHIINKSMNLKNELVPKIVMDIWDNYMQNINEFKLDSTILNELKYI